MNKENIIRLVKQFNKENYKDLFGALMIYETMDYIADLDDFNDGDIEHLEEKFNKFMKEDNISSFIREDLLED